jgi:hypothetical protein
MIKIETEDYQADAMEEKGVLLIVFICGHLHEGVSLRQRRENTGQN